MAKLNASAQALRDHITETYGGQINATAEPYDMKSRTWLAKAFVQGELKEAYSRFCDSIPNAELVQVDLLGATALDVVTMTLVEPEDLEGLEVTMKPLERGRVDDGIIDFTGIFAKNPWAIGLLEKVRLEHDRNGTVVDPLFLALAGVKRGIDEITGSVSIHDGKYSLILAPYQDSQ
jgi:hypothetical protein